MAIARALALSLLTCALACALEVLSAPRPSVCVEQTNMTVNAITIGAISHSFTGIFYKTGHIVTLFLRDTSEPSDITITAGIGLSDFIPDGWLPAKGGIVKYYSSCLFGRASVVVLVEVNRGDIMFRPLYSLGALYESWDSGVLWHGGTHYLMWVIP
jgi:hypothetical protein